MRRIRQSLRRIIQRKPALEAAERKGRRRPVPAGAGDLPAFGGEIPREKAGAIAEAEAEERTLHGSILANAIYKPAAGAHDPAMRKSLRDEHDDRQDDSDVDDDTERQTKALAGLALTLTLALLGCYLVIHLREAGQIEDCLLAQHSNCDALIGSR
jgi:hypothetical protein